MAHLGQSRIHQKTPSIVLQSVFLRYDEDNSGTIDEKEFENMMSDMHINDKDDVSMLFKLADKDNDKSITFDEFRFMIKANNLETLLNKKDDFLFIQDAYEAFRKYDYDGDGEISWNEFYNYLIKHGHTHHEISSYWYIMDDSNDADSVLSYIIIIYYIYVIYCINIENILCVYIHQYCC